MLVASDSKEFEEHIVYDLEIYRSILYKVA